MVCAKFVLQLLVDKKKPWHVFTYQDLLDEVRNDWYFVLRVVTGIETWVYWYGTETKQQSFQWNLVVSMSEVGKARQVKHEEHVDGLL
jgi:hypothetical protein